jgi:sugar phosphate isomerase/epimerase
MNITRREFLVGAAGGVAGTAFLLPRFAAAQGAVKIRLSACDWSLQAGGPDGLEIAKRVGLDGLEISPGEIAEKLQIADPAYRQKYKEAVQKTGVVVSSMALGMLNNFPLASDPRGPGWLEQSIDATKDLGGKVILLAFFGKGDLRDGDKLKKAELDTVIERIKDAAPKAKEAGVILGIENMLSAEQNLAILDRIQSDAVRIYYDIGNSTGNGYDVPAEIRLLGGRICQIHFKDGKHYLGQGDVKMDPVAEAINAINYKGWVVLETSIPSKDRDADFKKNADFVRKLMKLA